MFFNRPRVKFLGSLSFRVSAWYFLSLGLLIFIVTGFTYFYTASNLRSRLDENLLSDAESYSQVVKELRLEARAASALEQKQKLKDKFNQWIAQKNHEPAFFNKHIIITGVDGKILASSKKLILAKVFEGEIERSARVRAPLYRSVRLPEKITMRIITYPFYEKGTLSFYLQVGVSNRKEEVFLQRLKFVMGLLWPLTLLLVVAGNYILQYLLRPLYSLIKHMQIIDVESMDELPADFSSSEELKTLVDNYNAMLRRLREGYDKLKEFGADISHQLRTPLTILQGENEVILKSERPAEEYRAVLESNLEEIKGMIRVVERILLLGRIRKNIYEKYEEAVDLNELLSKIFKRFRHRLTMKQITYTIDSNVESAVLVDPFLVETLLMNLVDNAVKYCRVGGEIMCRLWWDEAQFVLEMANPTTEIFPSNPQKIFDRYYKGRFSSGEGLGLPIAQEIVKSYHGEIQIYKKDSAVISFCVKIPLAKARA